MIFNAQLSSCWVGLNLYFQGYLLKAVVDVMKMNMDVGKSVKVASVKFCLFNPLILSHRSKWSLLLNNDAVI